MREYAMVKEESYKTESYFRILETRATIDEKIVTVGIVSDKWDTYKTIIAPDGCTSPMESVPVDYNHNRISTGAYIVDLGVQEIDIDVNDKVETIKSRVVEIHVPKQARMWTKDNKEKKEDEVPSLYDNIANGRIRWVSVDFTPVKEGVRKIYDAADQFIGKEFRLWQLNFLSFLDTRAGQNEAYFLNVRKLNFNKRVMLKEVIDAITTALTTQEVELGDITNVELTMSSDDAGKVMFNMSGVDYSGNYTVADDTMVISDLAPVKVDDVEDKGSVDDKEPEKRAWVGDLIKNAEDIGVVTKKITESADGSTKTTLTITLLKDKSEVVVDESSVGYDNMSYESDGQPKEWMYVNQGMAVMYILDLLGENKKAEPKEEEVVNPDEAITKELEETKRQLQEKDDTIKQLLVDNEKYQRIALSPVESGDVITDAASDLAGERAAKDAKDSEVKTYAELKAESDIRKISK